MVSIHHSSPHSTKCIHNAKSYKFKTMEFRVYFRTCTLHLPCFSNPFILAKYSNTSINKQLLSLIHSDPYICQRVLSGIKYSKRCHHPAHTLPILLFHFSTSLSNVPQQIMRRWIILLAEDNVSFLVPAFCPSLKNVFTNLLP